ncbi:MAG: RNA polymerase sigma factor [Nitriliruptorales bacterium]
MSRQAIETGHDHMSTPATETSHDAFRRYVEPELGVLLRVARRMTGSTADAEDLVQETVMRAFRAIDRFDGRHPRAWLLTILRNTLYSKSRKRTPHLLYDQDREMERVEAHGADGRGGAEEIALHGRLDAALEEAMNGLPSKFRDVVLLVDVDGLSYQEAADVLSIPIGTVMSRLHRARNRLRDALEAAGYPGPWEEA